MPDVTNMNDLLECLNKDFKDAIVTEIKSLKKEVKELKEQQTQQLQQQDESKEQIDQIASDLNNMNRRSATAASSETVAPIQSGAPSSPIKESDLERIRMNINKGFKEGLRDCGEALKEVNCQVMKSSAAIAAEYTKGYAEQIDQIIQKNSDAFSKDLKEDHSAFEIALSTYAQNLTDRYAEAIERAQLDHEMFQKVLQDYSDQLADRNAQALQSVQKENNEELQRLSDALTELTGSQEKFVSQCTAFNADLKQDVQRILQQNSSVTDRFDVACVGVTERMDVILAQKLAEMAARLEQLEQNQAAAFQQSMEDYRERFIAANTAAVQSVQSEMIQKLEHTQGQITQLAEQLDKLESKINSICDAVGLLTDTTTDFQQKLNETIDSMLSNIQSQLKKGIDNYKGTADNISKSVKTLCETVQTNSDEIKTNSENYDKALKAIMNSQNKMHELTSQDIKLLERLLKS